MINAWKAVKIKKIVTNALKLTLMEDRNPYRIGESNV